MLTPPLVSILIPFYNAERFLSKAIESVWAQDYPNVELIAVNDGSTDRSLTIAEEMRGRSPIQMQIRSQPNSGPSAALHHALSLASGEWVAWVAADDMYTPNFISRSHSVAESLPMRDFVVHANSFLMETNGEITGIYTDIGTIPPLRGHAFEARVTGNGFTMPQTMFVRRELLLRAGGFDPEMRGSEDFDLFLRLTRAAYFEFIEEPLYYCRYVPGSQGKKPWLWADDIQRALGKHADILGERLPKLQALWAEHTSAFSFEWGNPKEGWRWALRSLRLTDGQGNRIRRGLRLTSRAMRGLARHTVLAMVGHERLVSIKRALTRERKRRASA